MRLTALLKILPAAFCVAASGPAVAAEEGLLARIEIAGTSLQCKDFRGQIVRTIRMNDIGDVARASIINRMPIITLNPLRLSTLPDKMQIFFFNHECAHHVLAHVFNPSPTSENEADCWSVKSGRDAGLFTRSDVQSFAPHFAASRGTAFGHLPGPERAARLVACFDDPTDNVVEPAGFRPSAASMSLGAGR